MPQIINTNIASLNAQRNLNTSQTALAVSLQRLSSGLRVNSAKDDAAGLAIAERMNAQVRGMTVAIRNANDAISFAQTAEGGVSKISDALQRMRELAVQSANGTNSSGDRANLQTEFAQLQAEITRLTNGTTFNGQVVLSGATAFTFQVGAGTNSAVDTISVTGGNLATGAVSSAAASAVSITAVSAATSAITSIDSALDAANTLRADFGAVQNRFESVISNLQIAVENQSAARSRIMDADFAAETAALTRAQILQQAGTAMLAQANAAPQNVLSLLR
jgi:flagellin